MDIYKLPFVGKLLLKRKIKKEGGELYSKTLRKITFEKNKVNVGLYTYGACFQDGYNFGGTKINVGKYCSIAGGGSTLEQIIL